MAEDRFSKLVGRYIDLKLERALEELAERKEMKKIDGGNIDNDNNNDIIDVEPSGISSRTGDDDRRSRRPGLDANGVAGMLPPPPQPRRRGRPRTTPPPLPSPLHYDDEDDDR